MYRNTVLSTTMLQGSGAAAWSKRTHFAQGTPGERRSRGSSNEVLLTHTNHMCTYILGTVVHQHIHTYINRYIHKHIHKHTSAHARGDTHGDTHAQHKVPTHTPALYRPVAATPSSWRNHHPAVGLVARHIHTLNFGKSASETNLTVRGTVLNYVLIDLDNNP